MLIDNLMGKNYLIQLNNLLEKEKYSHCTNTSGEKSVENSDWINSFSSIIYGNGEYHGSSDFIFNILIRALDYQDQELDLLLRIRLGLILRTPSPINHGEHVDWYDPVNKLRTGLFYINDSDGDTFIYKEKYNVDLAERPKVFNLKKQISPLENRWYDFDGKRYHNSTSPINHNYRLVLTFNYTIK